MKKADANLVSSAPNISYLTKFTGFSEIEREAFLLITKNKKILITDKRYSDTVRKKVKNIEIIETGAINFLINELQDFIKQNKIKTISFEENDLTVYEYKLFKKYVNLIPEDISLKRIIKKEFEINQIKKACSATDKSFKFILSRIKEGVTEKQIANELINYIRSNNFDPSFNPIIAFGSNSSAPHHQSNNTKLKKNQIILMDFGVKINGYCSDMTRTIFFGKADQKFKKIYKTVFDAQEKSFNSIKSNKKLNIIDKVARDYIIENGYPSIPHAVGHGIGLEVHEKPNVSPGSIDKIKNGIIFSIEPGIYIPGYGGVRIEDLILIKDNKPYFITHAKKELIEL